tara:strand:+ start:5474 stop:6247 length:774 start_codon:yes stop_codon:yes gene_type:complete
MLFCNDNLEVLRGLDNNLVDLIYCDILYGTGRNFGDYKDLGQEKNTIETHYVPRLQEMHRVLKDTGQIYLQMDWRINHWMRCILDDTFGMKNFRNEIIWHYNSAPRKKGCFGNRHDTILRYSKSEDFVFNPIRVPYSSSAPRGYAKEKYYHPDGKVIGDVWTDIPMLAQNDKRERCGYATQKPEALLERIILSSSNEGDIVADFYCGSGTTLVVAKKNKRKFLGCDISNKGIEITKARLEQIDGVQLQITDEGRRSI